MSVVVQPAAAGAIAAISKDDLVNNTGLVVRNRGKQMSVVNTIMSNGYNYMTFCGDFIDPRWKCCSCFAYCSKKQKVGLAGPLSDRQIRYGPEVEVRVAKDAETLSIGIKVDVETDWDGGCVYVRGFRRADDGRELPARELNRKSKLCVGDIILKINSTRLRTPTFEKPYNKEDLKEVARLIKEGDTVCKLTILPLKKIREERKALGKARDPMIRAIENWKAGKVKKVPWARDILSEMDQHQIASINIARGSFRTLKDETSFNCSRMSRRHVKLKKSIVEIMIEEGYLEGVMFLLKPSNRVVSKLQPEKILLYNAKTSVFGPRRQQFHPLALVFTPKHLTERWSGSPPIKAGVEAETVGSRLMEVGDEAERSEIIDSVLKYEPKLVDVPYGPQEHTLLMYSCVWGWAGAAKSCLKYGADVRAANAVKVTALMLAAKHGNIECVQVILQFPIFAKHLKEDNERDKLAHREGTKDRGLMGETPETLAARHGHAEVLTALLDAGFDLDTTEADGSTPLYLASQEGHMQCVRALLAHKTSTYLEEGYSQAKKILSGAPSEKHVWDEHPSDEDSTRVADKRDPSKKASAYNAKGELVVEEGGKVKVRKIVRVAEECIALLKAMKAAKIAAFKAARQKKKDDKLAAVAEAKAKKQLLEMQSGAGHAMQGDWHRYIDPYSGRMYYFNTETNESTYERPVEWVQLDQDVFCDECNVWVDNESGMARLHFCNRVWLHYADSQHNNQPDTEIKQEPDGRWVVINKKIPISEEKLKYLKYDFKRPKPKNELPREVQQRMNREEHLGLPPRKPELLDKELLGCDLRKQAGLRLKPIPTPTKLALNSGGCVPPFFAGSDEHKPKHVNRPLKDCRAYLALKDSDADQYNLRLGDYEDEENRGKPPVGVASWEYHQFMRTGNTNQHENLLTEIENRKREEKRGRRVI
jgi:hypothetical protein